MPKRKISQFETIEAEDISSADLYVIARSEVNNFSLTSVQQVDRYKDFSEIFPINFSSKYINNNTTKIGGQNLNVVDIDKISFDKFGFITDITKKETISSVRVLDCYSGSFDLRGNNDTVGYFYNDKPLNVPTQSWQFGGSPIVRYISTSITGSETGDWSLLFDREHDFKKSIITYTHSRLDKSGSDESISSFKFYIYWNGENNTQINGSGMIAADRNNPSSVSLIYPFKTLNDNTSYSPYSGSNYFPNEIRKAIISVDGKNKKIKKLPITPFIPSRTSDRQTEHGIYITVESFA